MMGYWQLSSPHKWMAAYLKITLRFGMGHLNANEFQKEGKVVTILKFGPCRQSIVVWLLRHSSCIDPIDPCAID